MTWRMQSIWSRLRPSASNVAKPRRSNASSKFAPRQALPNPGARRLLWRTARRTMRPLFLLRDVERAAAPVGRGLGEHH
jgi:hypothetical protein